MSEKSLSDLYALLMVLEERVSTIKLDLQLKHKENRASIHSLRNDVQTVKDEIWKVKIKIASYAALGGVLAQVLSSVVQIVFREVRGK